MAATVLATRQVPAGSGGINLLQVTIDFGSTRSDMAHVTVSGISWVTTNSIIVATPVAKSGYNTIEEVLLEELHVTIGNLVAGVGFDIYVYAPRSTSGQYNINILGA